MARNTSVTLGDHFEDFVAEQIAQGRYGSASEVIRASLRLLEEHEQRMTLLRRALVAGERDGGADQPFDIDDILLAARGPAGADG
ncbi:MAG: type II toxin-antitoxin system ParD family antitoxin [Rhodocyclaceae bacterium]|nr:type II toxin-antitoxin system ParD family antitoxin [Rhodocyclaceae bacterium]